MLRETDWADALHKELKKKIPLKKFVLVLSYSHSSTSNQPVTFYRCQTSSALWPHGYSQNTLQGASSNTHIKSSQSLHPINRVSNRYRLNIICNDNRETLQTYYNPLLIPFTRPFLVVIYASLSQASVHKNWNLHYQKSQNKTQGLTS